MTPMNEVKVYATFKVPTDFQYSKYEEYLTKALEDALKKIGGYVQDLEWK